MTSRAEGLASVFPRHAYPLLLAALAALVVTAAAACGGSGGAKPEATPGTPPDGQPLVPITVYASPT